MQGAMILLRVPGRLLRLVGWRGLAVACVGLALTTAVWLAAGREARSQARAHFDTDTTRAATAIRAGLVGHLRMIDHVSALLGVTWPLSQRRFELFPRRTQLARRYAAFHGLTFVEL